jgi:predicted permease
VQRTLQESARSQGGGQSRAKLRKLLLSLEIGLTVVLLTASGLLLKSYERLRASDLGCVTNNVLTLGFGLPDAQYDQPAKVLSFYEALLRQVRSLPGVQAAGLTTMLPSGGYWEDNGFAVAEHPPLPQGQFLGAIVRWVDPGYFATLGIPLKQGDTFRENDRLDKAFKVIVTESFARQYLPNENPIGKHLITEGDKSYEIVGVVGDTRYSLSKDMQPMMYFPIYGGTENAASLVIRSSRDPIALALPVQRLFTSLDADLPVSDVLTMDQVIGRSTVDASFNATLTLGFAVLSLVLASVGLYGVLSYLVAQRTGEIGVRMALGAVPAEVLRLMLADGLRPAVAGLALGLAAGSAAATLIRSLLYGVQPLDATVYVGVAAILLVVACAACVLPAWRASRLDPVHALRME